MIFRKELYREFEVNRLARMSPGPEAGPTIEAVEAKKNAPEKQEWKSSDELATLIQQRKKEMHSFLDNLLNQKDYREGGKDHENAKQFVAEMKTHIEKHLDSSEAESANKILEGAGLQRLKDIHQRADKLLKNLKERHATAIEMGKPEHVKGTPLNRKMGIPKTEKTNQSQDQTTGPKDLAEDAQEKEAPLSRKTDKVISLIYKNKDLRAIVLSNLKNGKGGDISLDHFDARLKNPANQKFLNALNDFAKNLNIDASTDLDKFQPSKEQMKKLGETIIKVIGLENVEAPNEQEIKFVMEFIEKNDTDGLSSEQRGKIAELLSMHHTIDSQNGELRIKENGEGPWKAPKSTSALLTYNPDKSWVKDYREAWKKQDGSKMKELRRQWGEEVGDKLEATKASAQMAEFIQDPSKIKGFDKMSMGELFATIAQIVALYKKATETGDYQSLIDGVNMLTNGKNIVEEMKNSKEVYAQAMEGKGFDEMFTIYHKPHEEPAKSLFGDTPFRGVQLRAVIEEKLAKQFNGEVSKIENIAGGPANTRFQVSKGNETYEIALVKTQNGFTFNRVTLDHDTEGNEQKINPIEKTIQGDFSLAALEKAILQEIETQPDKAIATNEEVTEEKPKAKSA